MTKSPCVILVLLCTLPIGLAQQVDTVRVGRFVPAGTLLGCTLDEPNFSSKTARPEDPVLCKTTSVEMFGRPIIPRGAYLSARLKAYRDPGHFVGKGWLQLEFESLTLPGGNIPLEAKVISATRYHVNADGKILGRGHPKRDAIEWTIPLLWPVKVLTLPARGPRPALKGETRLELRLMEDLVIPESAYLNSDRLISRTSAPAPRPDDRSITLAGSRLADFRAGDPVPPPPQPVASASVDRYQTAPDANRGFRPAASPKPTLLVLRDGRVFMADSYWLANAQLEYALDGRLHVLPLDTLDVAITRRVNAERGLSFVLVTKNR